MLQSCVRITYLDRDTIEQYITEHSHPGHYGEHLSIIALVARYNLSIVTVAQYDEPQWYRPANKTKEECAAHIFREIIAHNS